MVSFPFATPHSDHQETEGAKLLADATVVSAELAGSPIWLALGHDACRKTLSDQRFSREAALGPSAPVIVRSAADPDVLTSIDPPRHAQLRRLIATAFSPRMVEAMAPRVQQIVDDLLDAVQAGDRPADLVPSFVAPLPITVICDLLGMPGADHARIGAWSRKLMASTAYTPDEITAAVTDIREYLSGLVAEKRANPGSDLTSMLAAAPELTPVELLANLQMLLIAGHETTVNQLGNSIVALLRNPDQLALLRAKPELMPQAVEELMRYTRLTTSTLPRVATEDVDLDGSLIRKGEAVIALTGTANLDPRVFTDPAELNIERTDRAGQLGFGHGTHFCLGAHLARLELRTALAAVVTRFPDLALAVDESELRWNEGTPVRALKALPVIW